MKIKAVIITLAVGSSFFAFAHVIAQESAKKTPAAVRGICSTLGQEQGFMKSWAGQPGTRDHSESRTVNKGTWFGCLALAANGSSVPPACFLSYENDGHYTVPSRNAMTSPSADVVTLSCNGTAPTCCAVQVAGDLTTLKKADPSVKTIKPEAAKKQ